MKRLVVAVSLCLAGAQALSAETVLSTLAQSTVEHVDTLREQGQVMRAWGLTEAEAMRYEALMRGPRGAFSVANISPLEVLGIHAETPAQRRAYADRLVKLLYEDSKRVLAFERETQAAWQRLGQPLFDPARMPGKTAQQAVNKGQLWGRRLAVFVALKDCPRCAASARELVRMTGADSPLMGLDVYVVDSQDAEAIRAFARGVGIAPEAVSSRRITLNQGETLFRQY
ncbi:MAG: TIGR03759 family integrating conjugative element protein, partial [Sedimenticolaceae bacterium]